jgi:serine/threonine protein kinase
MGIYSQSLIDKVLEMLNIDPKKRPSAASLYAFFRRCTCSTFVIYNDPLDGQNLVFKNDSILYDTVKYTLTKRIGHSNAAVDLYVTESGEQVAIKKMTIEKTLDNDLSQTCGLILDGIALIRGYAVEEIAEVQDCYYYPKDDYTHILYIIMRYYPLGDLDKYTKNITRPVQEKTVIGILQQLVLGLSILHSNLIVHRDIKVCRNNTLTH